MRKLHTTLGLVTGALLLAACGTPPTNDGGDVVVNNDMPTVDSPTNDMPVIGMDATDVPDPTDNPNPPMGDGEAGAPPTVRTLPTNGSAVVLTNDDQIAVAVNRTGNSVSIFRTDFGAMSPTVMRTALFTMELGGLSTEPWAAVIGNDDDTAYVVLRRSQQVVKITNLHMGPSVSIMRATVGSEPTGIAISPTGQRLFVANYNEGTVSVVNTTTMNVDRTINLNATLANSGMLGAAAMGNTRPALAHPRALVVTNNGDTNDGDETVYVTEFFSQIRSTGVPMDDSQFDQNRQGVVYRFNVETGTVGAPITIAPVADTGFQDSANNTTGCIPNQLYSAAIANNRLFVTSVCESPRGPTGPVVPAMGATDTRNFQTEIHAVVNVVSLGTNLEEPALKVLLNQRLNAQYGTRMVADDATRRMPLIMNDINFVHGSNVAYVTAYGSDAVFRIQFAGDGTVGQLGTATSNFINLAEAAPNTGRLPVGIALASSAGHLGTRAVVINESTRNLSVVDLTTQTVTNAVTAQPAPAAGSPEASANTGRRLFVTGLGRWSFKGQGWNSCEACHPDGLSDNITWFFARGPRQTTSLDASFSPNGAEQRLFNWSAIFDEVHDFELNTRGNSGGLGAVVHRVGMPTSADDRIIFDGTAATGAQIATATPQAGLNGSVKDILQTGVPANPMGTVTSALPDWNDIENYIKTIRAPRRPVGLAAADVMAGRTLFETNNCGACHGGALWTISRRFWTPSARTNAAMGALRTTNYTGFAGGLAALNPASAMGMAPLRFTNADPAVVGANDQINCVLRAVGTIGPAPMGSTIPTAVAPMGVTVREVRQNFTAGMGMVTPAQGLSGFSPAGVTGMGLGAPYFHAGNARTLEELFDVIFQAHYQAHSANFLTAMGAARDAQVRQIVAFVLSIDDDTMPVPVQGSLMFNPQLCPASL